jgi:hypothetical protein
VITLDRLADRYAAIRRAQAALREFGARAPADPDGDWAEPRNGPDLYGVQAKRLRALACRRPAWSHAVVGRPEGGGVVAVAEPAERGGRGMAGGGIGEQSWRQVAPLQLTHPSKEDLHVRSRRSSGRGASLPVTISTGSTALTTLSTFSGAGIPAGASVVAVPSTATATLSVPADATGSVVADVGVDPAAAGWLGWVPTTAAEAASYSVAAAAAGTGPHDRMTDATTGAPQRTRAS